MSSIKTLSLKLSFAFLAVLGVMGEIAQGHYTGARWAAIAFLMALSAFFLVR